MDIGANRNRVTLETASAPVRTGGGYTETFTPLDPPVWDCAILPAPAGDQDRLVASAAVQTTAVMLVRGRYHPGITTETRITDMKGRRLRVQSVRNLDWEERDLELVCVEIVEG